MKVAQIARHELEMAGTLSAQRVQRYPEMWRVKFWKDNDPTGQLIDITAYSYQAAIIDVFKIVFGNLKYANENPQQKER